MIKKIIMLFILSMIVGLLAGCGSANFAPGKAYMEPSVGGVVNG
jgi:hypothetical protein